MNLQLSKRAQNVKPSPTMAVTEKIAQMKAEGKNIIGLGAGEPDFDTPEYIKIAAKKALDNGITKYTAVDGNAALKEAIIDKFQNENKLQYKADQIIVSCGAKHSLYNLFQAVLNPGNEVLVPTPYWVSYPDMIGLAGAQAIVLETNIKEKFKLQPQQLRDAITSKTRMLILNSPSNPTGTCYSQKELIMLGEVLLDSPDIIIVTDDIYEHILWGQPHFCNIVNVCPDLYKRTVVINGVSKAYAMTGWRIGYAGGPQSIIKAMKKIQSQSTSNPNSIAQMATIAALKGGYEEIKENIEIFKQRHDFVFEQLTTMPGIKCLPSDGTFYIFPDLGDLIQQNNRIENDSDLATSLIENAGVATVPGSAFGASGHLRISYATDMDTLEDAMNRIRQALQSI